MCAAQSQKVAGEAHLVAASRRREIGRISDRSLPKSKRVRNTECCKYVCDGAIGLRALGVRARTTCVYSSNHDFAYT